MDTVELPAGWISDRPGQASPKGVTNIFLFGRYCDSPCCYYIRNYSGRYTVVFRDDKAIRTEVVGFYAFRDAVDFATTMNVLAGQPVPMSAWPNEV